MNNQLPSHSFRLLPLHFRNSGFGHAKHLRSHCDVYITSGSPKHGAEVRIS